MTYTENLIELVKRNHILYDLSHEDYKNARKKDKVWEQIGAELKDAGDEVKKKWKNLRDTYMRHIKANKTKTGQAAKSGKKWQWSGQMEAFRPFLSFAQTSSNVPDIPESPEIINYTNDSNCSQTIESGEHRESQFQNKNSDNHTVDIKEIVSEDSAVTDLRASLTPAPALSTANTSTPFVTTISSVNKKKRKSEPPSSINSLLAYFQNKKGPEIEETDMLFIAHAKAVKRFSKKRQAIAKMEVAKIIMEQELLDIKEQSSSHQNQDSFRPFSSASSTTSTYNQCISPIYTLLDTSQNQSLNTLQPANPSDENNLVSNSFQLFNPTNK